MGKFILIENFPRDVIVLLSEGNINDENEQYMKAGENFPHDDIAKPFESIIRSYFLQYVISIFSLVLSLYIIINLDDQQHKIIQEIQEMNKTNESELDNAVCINFGIQELITSDNQNIALNNNVENFTINSINDCDTSLNDINLNASVNDINEDTLSNPIDECDLLKMKRLRLQNTKKIFMGHLNINSIPNKFDGIMDVIKEKLDIFLISETKIDDSFPEAQFFYNGYSLPHRRNRAIGVGGCFYM